MSDRALQVCETEVHQILVYKVSDIQLLHITIRNLKLVGIFGSTLEKPRLSGIRLLFVKGENDGVIGHRIHIKLHSEVLNLLEVLTSLGTRAGTQTLVVLDFPTSFTRTVPGSES